MTSLSTPHVVGFPLRKVPHESVVVNEQTIQDLHSETSVRQESDDHGQEKKSYWQVSVKVMKDLL